MRGSIPRYRMRLLQEMVFHRISADACGVSRDGSNAMNLIKFAREHGFDASGYSLELEELKELKSFPMVIHWKFNHFVVLERIKSVLD